MKGRKWQKKRKFTDAQISVVLKELDNGALVEDMCRKLGVSSQTINNWKKKYTGLEVPEIRRLRGSEGRNFQNRWT
jgi:putative transposase